jgi:hypothetical protein
MSHRGKEFTSIIDDVEARAERFSWTIGWPSTSLSWMAIGRAMTSVPPPAA